MALKFIVTRGVNIKNPQEIRYQGRLRMAGTFTTNQLLKKISEESSATACDVQSVLSALADTIVENCGNGRIVRLGELGSFRPTIKSQIVRSLEDWRSALISGVGIAFTPGELLRNEIKNSTFTAGGYTSTIDISQFADNQDQE